VIISVDPYPYGIAYHNHYFIRSGGTTRELSGIALSTFLMEKAGKHWDGMPIPGMKVSDLDALAIQAYRDKAVENGRHTKSEVNVSDEQIVSDLKLIDESADGNGGIMRAAMLLFHSDPEKYVTGASVKIAFFAPEGAYGHNKSDDIIYHDEIHGSLMLQADKVVDLVYTKYLKALVSYDGLQRVETYLTPKEAFREIVLNAINHKLYETGNPIQISVYEDRIVVFNQGYWPEDIDLTDLYTKKHSSYPHNPNIAKAFFNAGEIEAYGSGFSKIKIICDEMEAPYPELEITKNGVTVVIKACERYMNLLNHGRYWKTYPDNKEKIVDFLETESGEIITDNNGAPLVVETEKDVDSSVIASIDHMMEILAVELSESEKELYLPIAEYLKTHDTIRNSDVQHLLNRGDSTSNRHLKRLVELGVLIPEGKNKGRVYRRAPGDKS
jgi:ATP-dependent DNA helicase RecG